MVNFFRRAGRLSVMLVGFMAFMPIEGRSEVNWLLYAGGMYGKAWQGVKFYEGTNEKTGSFNFTGALNLQISLKGNFYIETGIGYRRGPFFSIDKDVEYSSPDELDPYDVYGEMDYNNWLQVPLKLGYSLPLGENTSLMLAVGPYVDMAFEVGAGDSPMGIGLMPSATLRHRKFNIGVQYQNPVFLNATRNFNKSVVMATVGINFHIGKVNFGSVNWDAVANTLSATGEALTVISGGVGASQSYSTAVESETSASTASMTSKGTKSKMNTSTSVPSDSKKTKSVSELNSWNTDKRTYSKEESLVIKLYNDLDDENLKSGDVKRIKKEIKDAQSRMKKLRSKWESRGYEMYKSEWETKVI